MKVTLVLLFISISINIYFSTRSDETMIAKQVEDSVSLSQASFNKNKCPEPTKTLSQPVRKLNYENKITKDKTVKEETSPFVDKKVEKRNLAKWFEDSSEFFEYELYLTPDQMGDYGRLAKNRKDDIISYINSVKKEKGIVDSNSFALSMEEAIKLMDINKKYLSKLKTVFGEEDYEYYSNFKKEFNKKLLKDPESWAFSIEF